MATPLLGEFNPNCLKKRPHIRTEVMESSRINSSSSKVNLYPYSEMIERAFNLMHSKNVESSSTSRSIRLPAIQIEKKAKKTIFLNFTTICKSIKRDPEHVKHYICTEQNTDASIDGKGGLIITGRLQMNAIEKYILQYVHQYVKCPVCGSADTKLEKNNRLLFIKCNQCTAQRSVQQIKAGYKASITKRKAA
ncbi:eukaryotic translation initiation factor 2 subunit beta-like [Histomonas meleagridis]|uniref:eukaryotic translation initiation factor 2 subunit beta-like n=1 Tax=Histomonas meleagridis TaxID=135588 RepID=UPI0035597623|nr:eukaryotic translation initiation factor 2 subunit beta-like [Histomonas meleagridis]KAH0807128.1 eukaryotic translation initiation factor 2 subunit beta-like [Histomonas meleagridis]